MKIAIIHSGQEDNLSLGHKLALFFSTRFLEISEVSPISVSNADVVLIEFANAQADYLQELRQQWSFLEYFPVAALVDSEAGRARVQAEAFGITNILCQSDELPEALALVKSLCAPDLFFAAVPEDVSFAMRSTFALASAHLEAIQIAAVTGDTIPVEAGHEVASSLLGALSTDGIHAWIRSVKCHHNPTIVHSLKVAGLAGWLACQLGWSEADCIQVTAGGFLHEIGKSHFPQSILDKQAAWNDEEHNLIRKHAQFGYDILKNRPEVDHETKEIVYFHHEFLDGSGYPFRISGEAIGPKVRVMAIAELFAALTDERACKASLANSEAIAVMNKMHRKIDQAFYAAFRYGILSLSEEFDDVKRVAS